MTPYEEAETAYTAAWHSAGPQPFLPATLRHLAGLAQACAAQARGPQRRRSWEYHAFLLTDLADRMEERAPVPSVPTDAQAP